MQNSPPTQRAKASKDAYSWLPKLSKVLLALILIFSSTQLGYHFWPDSALVYGIRVDYLSPVIYFLDLLIILYLLLLPRQKISALAKSPLISIGLPILLTNLLFSTNPLATLSWSLHLLLYLVFILSLHRSTTYHLLSTILPLSMLFQVTLGAIQVFLGHTLQGPLYWLGERALSVGTPTVARASLFGQTMLRAYGTFSHPNILAGWLVVSLLVLVVLSRHRSSLFFPTLLASLGILLTQSRTSAFALFGLIIPVYLLRRLRPRLVYFVFLLFALSSLLFTRTLSRPTDTSLADRLTLQQLSLRVTGAFPIFGTGTSASISSYPLVAPTIRLLQPDHDSFTLLLSWFGLFGLLGFAFLVLNFEFSVLSFLPLLPLLLFDHYLLTSPQGLLLFLLYLRVTISYGPKIPRHSH